MINRALPPSFDHLAMKITPLAILALALTLSASPANATDLKPGQTIGIDLGATKPLNHFNSFDPSAPDTPADGILATVQDTTGTTIAGITVHFGGTTVQSALTGTPQDIANTPGFDVSNLEDAVTGYNLTLTFTGLNPIQTFTLLLVSSYSGYNIGTEFVCATQTIATDSTSTTGGTLASFENVTPDANGQISIAAFSLNSPNGPAWSGVNAVLLKAVTIPEPALPTLILIGITALSFAHRLRSARLRAKR